MPASCAPPCQAGPPSVPPCFGAKWATYKRVPNSPTRVHAWHSVSSSSIVRHGGHLGELHHTHHTTIFRAHHPLSRTAREPLILLAHCRHRFPRRSQAPCGRSTTASSIPHAGGASAPNKATILPPPAPDRPRRNLAGPPLAGAQGAHCNGTFLSRVLPANQGPMCESLKTSRDRSANCILNSGGSFAEFCKIRRKL
jgi:hypothetical protein